MSVEPTPEEGNDTSKPEKTYKPFLGATMIPPEEPEEEPKPIPIPEEEQEPID